VLQTEFPGLIESCLADLAVPESIERIREDLRLDEGLSGYVANAAVAPEGTLTLTSRRTIENCVDTNVLSVILMARQAVKPMLTTGGSIVFVSSVAAIRGFAGLSVYSATKGALLSFSRSLAREFGARGIRSNCLLPGFIDTEMSRGLSEEGRVRVHRRTPLGRFGKPNDVVGTVGYLLSDEARFITGAEIVIDGGLSA
jgi:3-oxoacyl-[acyl-carrier protein] reductase